MDTLKCLGVLALGTVIGCINAAKKSDKPPLEPEPQKRPPALPAMEHPPTLDEMGAPMSSPLPMGTMRVTEVTRSKEPPPLPMDEKAAKKKPAMKRPMRRKSIPIRVPLYE